jgi:hypothetical protein
VRGERLQVPFAVPTYTTPLANTGCETIAPPPVVVAHEAKHVALPQPATGNARTRPSAAPVMNEPVPSMVGGCAFGRTTPRWATVQSYAAHQVKSCTTDNGLMHYTIGSATGTVAYGGDPCDYAWTPDGASYEADYNTAEHLSDAACYAEFQHYTENGVLG